MYGQSASKSKVTNGGGGRPITTTELSRDGNGNKPRSKVNSFAVNDSGRYPVRRDAFGSSRVQHQQFDTTGPGDWKSTSKGSQKYPARASAGSEIPGGAGDEPSGKTPAWLQARRQILEMEVTSNLRRKDRSPEADKARQKTQSEIIVKMRELQAQRAEPDVIHMWREFLSRQRSDDTWNPMYPDIESN